MIGSVAGCAQCDVPLAEDLVFTGPKASLSRTVALANPHRPTAGLALLGTLDPGDRTAQGHRGHHRPSRPARTCSATGQPGPRRRSTKSPVGNAVAEYMS
jgi:hypothetical protein